MQGAEIDLGGFKGRTNKLVDACYSWWVGASFALLEALGVGGSKETEPTPPPEQSVAENDEAVWDDVDGQRTPYRLSVLFLTSTVMTDTLLNRKALQEFILYAGQHPAGGLRDKPPKYAHFVF
jgi:protein farnesyltransferase subunit beta